MSNQVSGILLGTLAAIVLTPLIAALWRRWAPPSEFKSSASISPESWRRSERLATEATIVTVLLNVLLVGYVGFTTEVDGVLVAIIVGSWFGVPTVWMLARTFMLNKGALVDFVRFFEASHGITFRSWMYVSVPGFVVCVSCFTIFVLRQ